MLLSMKAHKRTALKAGDKKLQCDEVTRSYNVTEAHRHVQESLPARPWGRAWAGRAWACHARREGPPGCRRAWRGARRAAGARGCPHLPRPGPCLLHRASRAGPALEPVHGGTAPLCNRTSAQYHQMSAPHCKTEQIVTLVSGVGCTDI